MSAKIPRVGLGIFVFRNGKFLMGCRKGAHGDGTWSVPGGHLEYGESIEQGARREVLEETGLRIKNVEVAGITNDIFKTEDKHYITIWVTSNWVKGSCKTTEPDKFLRLAWHDFNSLPKKLFLPWKELLKSKFVGDIKRKLTQSSSDR